MWIKKLLLILLLCSVCQAVNDFSGDTNLIALYNLENGALLTDSSGNGETLTDDSITADAVNYKQGSASGFANADGDELYRIDADLSADFPGKSGAGNKTFSVCFWMRCTDLDATNYIVSKWGGTPSRLWSVNVTDTNVRWLISATGSDAEALTETNTTIGENKWYHVGATYNVDKTWRIRIWDVDATSVAESTGTGSLLLGDEAARFSLFNYALGISGFEGNLDEVVIFKDVLTADEIDQIRAGTYSVAAPSATGQVIMIGN